MTVGRVRPSIVHKSVERRPDGAVALPGRPLIVSRSVVIATTEQPAPSICRQRLILAKPRRIGAAPQTFAEGA